VDEAIRSLTLYTGVLGDEIGRTYREMIDLLTPLSPDEAAGGNGAPGLPAARGLPSVLYRRLFALLADGAGSFTGTGDAWRQHLLHRILTDVNAFSRMAETDGPEGIASAVRDAVSQDLHGLYRLYAFGGEALREAVERREPDALPLPSLDGLHAGAAPDRSHRPEDERQIREQFRTNDHWEDLLEPLAAFIHRNGLGIFRQYTAFRWESRGGEGRLVGIGTPDPVHLDDLFAYEGERELLIRNTEQFVAGFPSNNVLLYGDRGTGKSSTVKALLHAYADRGLRMVEVQKEHLGDFPQILRLLRRRRERFVVFIDDLSFEEHETHYKDLKALLEGSLEARPDNMVLYATSNRRHLVKERFSDRIHKMEDDEIHLNDTSEEKLSLSDRFGLTLTFVAPTQERYLAIVRGIAERRGIRLPDGELRSRALAWATQRGGRSGRVARQFTDHLAGELGLKETSTSPAPRER
jgi:predicted AAA+ superfamily ATPase